MTEPQSDPRFLTTETPAGSLTVDPALGNIRHLAFHADDWVIAPLHAAPWIEEPESDALPLAPVERHLSGDLFCAPFGANDLGVPPGVYLALLSHSGSRGPGAKVAKHYSDLAMAKHPGLPRELRHLAWLPMDEEGAE